MSSHKCYTIEKRYKKEINEDFKGEMMSESIKFNFGVETSIEPGKVSFTTGFNNDKNYESTFILTSGVAVEIAAALMKAAEDAEKRKLLSHEAYIAEGKLSYLVINDLIDDIRISRRETKSNDYGPQFYIYEFNAYKDKKCIFSYETIIDLQFDTVNDFKFWRDCLTRNGKVKVYFNGYDPENEAKEREKKLKEQQIAALDKFYKTNPVFAQQVHDMYKKPNPVSNARKNNIVRIPNKK